MSFIRIIYKLLIPHKIAFSLEDIPKALKFLNDIVEGRYVDKIEKHEMEKSRILAKYIEERAELMPIVQTALNKKGSGEAREALLQHRVLVHALFYNKTHILGELSRIIDELEYTTRVEEETNNTMTRIAPQPQYKTKVNYHPTK